MGWREWLKGKNQPPGRRHGGTPADNTGGNKQGRSDNSAKKTKKKPNKGK